MADLSFDAGFKTIADFRKDNGPAIGKLQEEVDRLNSLQKELLKQDDQQISETDTDVRSMATSGRGIVG